MEAYRRQLRFLSKTLGGNPPLVSSIGTPSAFDMPPLFAFRHFNPKKKKRTSSLLPRCAKHKNTVPPALDCPPSSEPVAAAFEWNPTSQNHTPWCTVKERYEGCIRQGAHGAEEHPCPGLRTNLQYKRNGARNTGLLRFVVLKMTHEPTESATVMFA